ncbi:hypothetical protein [Janthinobacterium fluminis]|uniref:Uncharacterized protein n=1 Tax=Janthinobacterium fluminis TaxID=2987524 RepID=A0ABT5K3N1_9BURK|nr:hypothetical protein [Janthinobacterium fluminis]MDC8758337.1 hypothetical protein [Janthinobacterium fluminis]
MTRKRTAACLLLAISAAALAGPAPWYVWVSKTQQHTYACAQVMPGPGWEKAMGPYQDSHCEKLIVAK